MVAREEGAAASNWEFAVAEETKKLLGGAEKTTSLRSRGKIFLWI